MITHKPHIIFRSHISNHTSPNSSKARTARYRLLSIKQWINCWYIQDDRSVRRVSRMADRWLAAWIYITHPDTLLIIFTWIVPLVKNRRRSFPIAPTVLAIQRYRAQFSRADSRGNVPAVSQRLPFPAFAIAPRTPHYRNYTIHRETRGCAEVIDSPRYDRLERWNIVSFTIRSGTMGFADFCDFLCKTIDCVSVG